MYPLVFLSNFFGKCFVNMRHLLLPLLIYLLILSTIAMTSIIATLGTSERSVQAIEKSRFSFISLLSIGCTSKTDEEKSNELALLFRLACIKGSDDSESIWRSLSEWLGRPSMISVAEGFLLGVRSYHHCRKVNQEWLASHIPLWTCLGEAFMNTAWQKFCQ